MKPIALLTAVVLIALFASVEAVVNTASDAVVFTLVSRPQ